MKVKINRSVKTDKRVLAPLFLVMAVLFSACSEKPSDEALWGLRDLSELEKTVKKPLEREYIRYGYKVITETNKIIGTAAEDPDMRYAGNNLNCSTCHLNAGTKKYGIPYVGLAARFPQYRGREHTVGTLTERINGCMERSMAGRKLPPQSKEMKAMLAYMKYLSDGITVNTANSMKGIKTPQLEFPDRAADPEAGKIVYEQKCMSCHQKDGGGFQLEDGTYSYPALWGEKSYNDGAGMFRVMTFARFVYANMPLGATYDKPQLTVDEAYDVAAYVNSHERPHKKNRENDFAGALHRKPVDTAYGPYADDFSQQQHKYGPYGPIKEYYNRQKK